MYCLSSLTSNTIFKGSADLELLIVSLKTTNSVVIVALMYRPPSLSDLIFDELLTALCSHVDVSLFDNFVLIGDFNVNLFAPCNASDSLRLLAVTNSLSLSQVVTEPTRISNNSRTLIDLIFLSSLSQLSSCYTIPSLANSDHLGLHLSLSIPNTQRTSQKVSSRRKLWRYDHADFEKAAELINTTNWDPLLTDNMQSSLKNWQTKFMEIMHSCIPQVIAKPRNSLPWINKQILQAILKRNTFYRKLKGTGDYSALCKYKSLRNKVVSLLRQAKKKFFEKLNSADQKVFWKTVKMLNNTTSSFPTLTTQSGVQAVSSSNKASTLNEYFFSCFNTCLPPLSEENHIYSTPSSCPESFLIAEEYVATVLLNLDVSKSTGVDGISAKMLKQTALSIAPSLTKLFNLSITTGCFPEDWKIARIVPISKADNRSSPANYRPISILPIISKVLEGHISSLIMNHLESVAPISSNQWGFMLGRSTTSALLSITNDCLQALDMGYDVCAVFFDIRKAFDSVPHRSLMNKLRDIGLDDYLLRWLHTYLLNRKQLVVVDGESSEELSVLSGVPQGSVLGPLLFLTYINEVTKQVSSNSNTVLFADDIALYRVISTPEDYIFLQSDINSITD